MEPKEYKRVKISDKDIKAILFRNFAGAPDKYHTDGCMPNFWIVLTDEKGQDLELNERLNIRWKPNRDGDLEPRLQVLSAGIRFRLRYSRSVEIRKSSSMKRLWSVSTMRILLMQI